ncbi:uncharacterized protein LOC115918415 [Strongylocentrotus purpuratus]|uniref:Uncharacterized protein n=2 Tax=Strongylocentrotus purpuratus TaxID=7668 RepID=A0A7M7NC04_STRPU|nr:uncharacterized protein LOC115918415 [Strongylocentrotus purpuratus]
MSTTSEHPLQEKDSSETPSPSTQSANYETKSVASRRSQSSKHSSVVSEALRARANAEASKVRLEFARKEAELQKQRAAQDAELFVLGAERDAAMAEVQVSVFEEGLEDFGESVKSVDLVLPQKDSRERVEEFLLSCDAIKNVDGNVQANINKISHKTHPISSQHPEEMVMDQEGEMQTECNTSPNVVPTCSPLPLEMENGQKGSKVVDNASNVVLTTPSHVETVVGISDLSNMLLKKELITSGLRKFNDHAFSYRSWKASLKQVTTELKLKPFQEMDLIIRWLGKESSQLVSAIYDIHVDKPKIGLDRMWELLDRKYGSPEAIEQDLHQRIEDFPKLTQKDYEKLEQYGHLLLEIEYAKDNGNFPGLLHLDSARGLHGLVQKLPHSLQERWVMEGSRYKERNHVTFPPFKVFSEFVRYQAKIRNDPSFIMPRDTKQQDVTRRMVSVRATDVKTVSSTASKVFCPIHKKNHSILECKAFLAKTVPDKKTVLKQYQLCYRCCFPGHAARECKAEVKCDSCGSQRHQTILHYEYRNDSPKSSQKAVDTPPSQITNACSKVQGTRCIGSRSCAKIVPVFVRSKRDQKVVKTYAIIDDQSNKTIATSQLLDKFDIDYGRVSYTLRTCSGEVSAQGRYADEFVVEDLNGTVCLSLPTVTECAYIPDFKDDIPTPEIVQAYDHLKGIEIPEIDHECTATLLIGRDVMEAHHVLDQRIGPPNSPFAQRLKLGWVIIGDVCLQGIHRSDKHSNRISLLRTRVLSTGRPTYLEPCPNEFQMKHLFDNEDDTMSLAIEEQRFVDLMVEEAGLKNGKWTAPLPFKQPRDRLPNNRQQAFKRAQILKASMEKNHLKREHMTTFMAKVLSEGHAEVAPSLQENEECWYLPMFGVYHPRKKDKIRGVFDSSAEFMGHSLNKVLLKGPDLTNDLVGVLMRFRQGPVAVCGDIESMFYCFSVSEEHRNFLRFFWHEDNDFAKPLTEYRMLKHVFGNTPSPAVANYGLRDLTSDAEPDVRDFVHNNFYVDDGLAACDDSNTAVSLMERTRAKLKEKAGIRLHKIASNSQVVLDAFEPEEVQKDIRNLTLSDGAPTQRSLGVQWNLKDDTFIFQIELAARPYTKRGVLSMINGVFDPLGFLAPVMVQARVLFREMTTHQVDWDDKLPEMYKSVWESWTSGLSELQSVSVPRNYPICLENGVLNVYCDASEVAVAAVAYLIDVDQEKPSASFVFGKSKLAPRLGHTIPRLELCAAVLGTEIARIVCRELNIQASTVVFHSDSRIVLGYLNNTVRRFHTYIANRVHKVLSFSQPSQWRYVPTSNNPADFGTRPVSARSLKDSPWLIGPQKPATQEVEDPVSEFPLVDPDRDEEIRHDVKIQVTKTNLELRRLVSRFEKFSTWNSLVRAFGLLVHIACSFSSRSGNGRCHGWHVCGATDVELVRRVKTMIVKEVQEQFFHEEYECLREGVPLPSNSTIRDLSPILNQDGLICVGGRLRKSSLPVVMKHPVLIPGKSHIAKLLVLHYHNNGHSGRQLTEGALRDAGFWITGGKRVISSVIHRCVNCRKLRGKTALQRMADLPQERLKAGPPFSQVGVDCFGPWEVVTRKTRGGAAQSKRWGMIFSCLTSRAIHIEVLEEMSTSSCINALRRFMAVRGKVETFWSDRGSNFVGVLNDKVFHTYLERNDTEWKLNPPHAPHMGGVWERMIGLFKGILNGILLEAKQRDLTHETLATFMMEAMAIVNARPLVPLSSDPEDTSFLSPSMLLTQKHGSIEEVLVEDCTRNMYKAQWKRVQILADRFWKQWRLRYLQSLQQRRKWISTERNVKKGDIVLLRDKEVKRNLWPLGIIESVSPGDDGLVRQVQVRLPSTGKTFCRPIHELILLVEAE